MALSLEDCNPPSDLADTLNAVRLGGGDGSCLRYYDKVQEIGCLSCGVLVNELHSSRGGCGLYVFV